jgi:TPR repeat protein
LLERAAESDEGVAIFVLAETYDPQILARWGVLGVKPDLEKARALYEKAETRGVQGAKERLLAIRK